MHFVHACVHILVFALPWAMWHCRPTHKFTSPWVYPGLSGCPTKHFTVASWGIYPGSSGGPLTILITDQRRIGRAGLQSQSHLPQRLLLASHPSLIHLFGRRGPELEPDLCPVLTNGCQPPWASVSTYVKMGTVVARTTKKLCKDSLRWTNAFCDGEQIIPLN